MAVKFSGFGMMAHPMECHCISATQIPHTTQLYSSYLNEFAAVAEFFGHAPTMASVSSVARGLTVDLALRSKMASVLRGQNRGFGADGAVEASLDQFAAGAATVVSGQQVGLFSGPTYTIYKVLSALRVAEELRLGGKPAVAVFWLAAEDHDLAEINQCFWPTRGGFERLELPREGSGKRRVGELRLGEEVLALVERATGMLQGPAAEPIAEALRASYQPTETYGSAFGKLLAQIFTGTGLILLDPLSAELHALAAPIYRAALEQHTEIAEDLLARSKALEKRGLHAQVKVTERNTLLFVDQEQERLPLRARNGDFSLGRRTVSLQQMTDLLGSTPEVFSANVLLRPIVQDLLLSTTTYIAGAAETAYFAQASVAYKRLLGRMPVILPRASCTLVEPYVGALLRKYGLEFTDLFRGARSVRSKMETAMMPRGVARRFAEGEKMLRKMLKDLRQPVAKLDPTLTGALETSERKMLYQYAHLQEKAGRALSFRSGVLDGHQRTLLELLYPNGELQERALCFLPTLAAHGFELLDELGRKIMPGGAQHQVLYL
jgi:bacillithiol biosynthesis cysteine-adding enzyme BshC